MKQHRFAWILLALFLVAMPALGICAAVVHGNYQSKIYHNASCRYFNCKKCTVIFQSAQEAKAQGYRACKICGG